MLEVAYIFVAIALVVFLVYLIITLQKVGRIIDETEKTVKTLTSDVDVTLHQTNELLTKVNVLVDDINVNPLVSLIRIFKFKWCVSSIGYDFDRICLGCRP